MKNSGCFWMTGGAVGLGLLLGVLVLAVWPEGGSGAAAVKDANPAVRAWAIRKLSRDGNVQLLIEALHDEDSDVRLIAVEHLGGKGSRGVDRAKALVPILKDDHATVRREVAWSLGSIGREVWPVLQDALSDENPLVRSGAARALGDAHQWKDFEGWPSREQDR